MSNSKKRGWLWCGFIGMGIILVVILWPNPKGGNKVSTIEVLDDSIVESLPPQENQYRTSQTYAMVKSKETTHPIDYAKLYERSEIKTSKYDTFRVKLNIADTNDLKELKGIGSRFANRIVNYRQILGGYRTKEQIKEVYGMTDDLYQLIEPHLVIDTENIVKININEVPLDKLKRHPYLDYYQAKAIVKYRGKIGFFKSTEELLNVSLIDTATFNRIRIYITI